MFEFFRHFTSKTKILFIGFILILIPVAIISHLSLQSVNSKAENLEIKYKGTVRLVRDKLESEILKIETSLRNSVLESVPEFKNEKELKSWLKEINLKNPAFQNLLLINEQGGLLSPDVSDGWQPGLKSNSILMPPLNNDFLRAEKAELRDKHWPEAISFYQNALEKATSDQECALILSRIGRCYFKAGNFEHGIEVYKKILELNSEGIAIGNTPVRAVALSQMASGFNSLNNKNEQQKANLKLYAYLLDFPWDISGGDFLYYLRSAGSEFKKPEAAGLVNDSVSLKLEELKNRERELLDQISFIQLFKQNILPEIELGNNLMIASENPIHKMGLNKNEVPLQFGLFKLSPAIQQSGLQVFGYQFNEDYLLSARIYEILSTVELGRDVRLGILNEKDSLLFIQNRKSIRNYLVTENFELLFGNWKVALFDKDGQTIEHLVRKEKNLYRFLFGGIILLMLIGIFVMIRVIIHESEMARIKSEFVSNVSHELKTPLALIRMFGETLDSGVVNDEKKRKEFYGIIRKESERLTHLINNVLDFSKMDSGSKKYHFHDADLVQLVKSSLETYTFHIHKDGFEIKSVFPKNPIMVHIDKDSISQVILNLLSNAVKYSNATKYIKIEVWNDANSAFISVSDRGIGIPKEELKKIFDKFYRIPGDALSESSGSGLGLTLTSQIVEAHKGKIEVKSEVGQGSRFTITIPLKT